METIELGNAGLTLDFINELLEQPVKEKGVIKAMLKKAIADKTLALDFTERFPTNVPTSLKANVKLNIDKLEGSVPNFRIMLAGDAPQEGEKDERHVILINLDIAAERNAQ